MLKKLKKENMGTSNLGWLESRFHFSFAEYQNHKNMSFGVLRVLNDDIIHPNGGFGTHPHKDMEIISYVVDGEITHKDNLGNKETLYRGEVQYMSAGSGVLHSEYNKHNSKDLRLLQIWIVPPKRDLKTLYGSYNRKNRLLNIVSSLNTNAKVKIYQDIDIYVAELDKGKGLEYKIEEGKQLYFVQIEGTASVNDIELNHGDAMEITKENLLHVKALVKTHCLFIIMNQEAI